MMKKLFTIICILVMPLSVFAEMKIFAGAGLGYKNINAEYDNINYAFNGLEVQIQPGFYYFPTLESKFGLGLNASYNMGFGNLDFRQKDGNKILTENNTQITWFNSHKYYVEKDNKFNYADISITPLIYYRAFLTDTINLMLALGPSYSFEPLSYYITKDPVTVNGSNGYANATSKTINKHNFSLNGEVGIYTDNYVTNHFSCYFKVGNLEYSEFTGNKLQFKPSFTIGLIYKLGFLTIETGSERESRINQETKEKEENRRIQEENARRYQEEQNRKYREQQEKIFQEEESISKAYGKNVIRLDSYYYNNPYAFDRNVIYHYVGYLYQHAWMSQGLIVGTYTKSANQGNDTKFYIYSVPDIGKISDCISNVYMIYTGTSEFTNGLGGTVILPTFTIIQYNY